MATFSVVPVPWTYSAACEGQAGAVAATESDYTSRFNRGKVDLTGTLGREESIRKLVW